MTATRVDEGQRAGYQAAVSCVAQWVVATLNARGEADDGYMEAAAAEVRRLEAEEHSEHLWIFRDPVVLTLSDRVFEALDEQPDGTRAWLHADTASAVAAVARHDVMVAVSWMDFDPGDEEMDDEGDEGLPGVGVGRA